jgi:hypothetical protein
MVWPIWIVRILAVIGVWSHHQAQIGAPNYSLQRGGDLRECSAASITIRIREFDIK